MLGDAGEDVPVTELRHAEAPELLSLELAPRCRAERGLRGLMDPHGVFLDDLGAIAMLADAEWIAPLAGPSDIHDVLRAGRPPDYFGHGRSGNWHRAAFSAARCSCWIRPAESWSILSCTCLSISSSHSSYSVLSLVVMVLFPFFGLGVDLPLKFFPPSHFLGGGKKLRSPSSGATRSGLEQNVFTAAISHARGHGFFVAPRMHAHTVIRAASFEGCGAAMVLRRAAIAARWFWFCGVWGGSPK